MVIFSVNHRTGGVLGLQSIFLPVPSDLFTVISMTVAMPSKVEELSEMLRFTKVKVIWCNKWSPSIL